MPTMWAARGWSGDNTELIAHEEFEEEQRYLTELNPYLHQRNRTCFLGSPRRHAPCPAWTFEVDS